MKDITEAYVSFDTAKLLKEKGFDEVTNTSYVIDNTDRPFVKIGDLLYDCSVQNHLLAAPTQQMAMRWLREVKEIIITIDYNNDIDCFDDKRFGFSWYAPPHFGVDLSTYKTYEEAVEAAIKYTLENLT